jgi:hypothetical protein
MTVSAPAEQYVGRRVIVVGLARAGRDAIAMPLIAAGVEVHVVIVTGDPGDRWPGVASWTECEHGSIAEAAAAIARIGAVVQDLFCCWAGSEAIGAVVEAVEPLMHVGGSIVIVDRSGPDGDAFVAARAPDLAAGGIRLVSATAADALTAGAPGLA